jgi:hypothetical protein
MSATNKDQRILRQAIRQLPIQSPPSRVWERIEQALEKDQGHAFPDQASLEAHWALVKATVQASEQRQDAILRRAIRQLPHYHAGEHSFEQLSDRLPQPKPVRTGGWHWAAGIAASILVLLTLFWFGQPDKSAERILVTYSQETAHPMDWSPIVVESTGDDEVLAFIRANCDQVAIRCQAPRFKGLFEEYLELQAAKQELENQIRLHQRQPELVRYLVRIEKEKTQVGKQLIQYLLL